MKNIILKKDELRSRSWSRWDELSENLEAENKKLKIELQEANDYADRLIEHKDMVCLPADLANLREANARFATENEELERERDDAREQRAKAVEKYQASIKEMHEVGMQRDRLATALQNLCDSFLGNKSSRDITAQLVEAGKALATLNQPEP